MNRIIFLISIIALFSFRCIYSMHPLCTAYEQEALQQLALGNLEKFDALVGDNACQIRALHIAMLYDKFKAAETLTPDERDFVTLSFMLTKSKEVIYIDSSTGIIEKEKANYKLLDSTLGEKKGRDLIKKLQVDLSQLSVSFLQQQALLLNNQELQQALRIVLTDDPAFKRKIVACYPGMKLILSCMVAQERPLIIKLTLPCTECSEKKHTLSLFYKPAQEGGFICDTPEQSDLQRAALVIEGFCNAQQTCKDLQINKHDIVNIILANAAAHTQFVGKKNEGQTVLALQGQLAFYNNFAQQEGCSKENPSLFCIDHIVCKTVKEALIS